MATLTETVRTLMTADPQGGWLRRLLLFNPVTYVAHGYRNVFIYKKWFFEDGYASLAFAAMLTAMLLLSLYTYHRLRRDIADVL